MNETPPLEGDPFVLARSSCRHAVQVARDVFIDASALQRFASELDPRAINNLRYGSMGENCDTVADDFRNADDAVNFSLLFCILQFGHGFRHELHQHCGRGASQTITRGVRALHKTGELSAVRLRGLTAADIRQAFALPDVQVVDLLAQQLTTVIHQAAMVLERLRLQDFSAFCQRVMEMPAAQHAPSATLVQQLAYHFPAFNDQGILHDSSRVVLVKKASLAVGELRRLALPHDTRYTFAQDLEQAVAPVDNVIPAMLTYHGILRLSPALHEHIHGRRVLLPRGPQEAELRAVSLAACDEIVAAAGNTITAVDLGYYLWRSGKEPGKRQFPRHHTQGTVFY